MKWARPLAATLAIVAAVALIGSYDVHQVSLASPLGLGPRPSAARDLDAVASAAWRDEMGRAAEGVCEADLAVGFL